jgi:hypothetical protein
VLPFIISFYVPLINAQANVAVVAVPFVICQRMYLRTVAVVPSATIPDLGVVLASIEPLVAPDNALKSPFPVLAAASSMESVTVPSELNSCQANIPPNEEAAPLSMVATAVLAAVLAPLACTNSPNGDP